MTDLPGILRTLFLVGSILWFGCLVPGLNGYSSLETGITGQKPGSPLGGGSPTLGGWAGQGGTVLHLRGASANHRFIFFENPTSETISSGYITAVVTLPKSQVMALGQAARVRFADSSGQEVMFPEASVSFSRWGKVYQGDGSLRFIRVKIPVWRQFGPGQSEYLKLEFDQNLPIHSSIAVARDDDRQRFSDLLLNSDRNLSGASRFSFGSAVADLFGSGSFPVVISIRYLEAPGSIRDVTETVDLLDGAELVDSSSVSKTFRKFFSLSRVVKGAFYFEYDKNAESPLLTLRLSFNDYRVSSFVYDLLSLNIELPSNMDALIKNQELSNFRQGVSSSGNRTLQLLGGGDETSSSRTLRVLEGQSATIRFMPFVRGQSPGGYTRALQLVDLLAVDTDFRNAAMPFSDSQASQQEIRTSLGSMRSLLREALFRFPSDPRWADVQEDNGLPANSKGIGWMQTKPSRTGSGNWATNLSGLGGQLQRPSQAGGQPGFAAVIPGQVQMALISPEILSGLIAHFITSEVSRPGTLSTSTGVPLAFSNLPLKDCVLGPEYTVLRLTSNCPVLWGNKQVAVRNGDIPIGGVDPNWNFIYAYGTPTHDQVLFHFWLTLLSGNYFLYDQAKILTDALMRTYALWRWDEPNYPNNLSNNKYIYHNNIPNNAQRGLGRPLSSAANLYLLTGDERVIQHFSDWAEERYLPRFQVQLQEKSRGRRVLVDPLVIDDGTSYRTGGGFAAVSLYQEALQVLGMHHFYSVTGDSRWKTIIVETLHSLIYSFGRGCDASSCLAAYAVKWVPLANQVVDRTFLLDPLNTAGSASVSTGGTLAWAYGGLSVGLHPDYVSELLSDERDQIVLHLNYADAYGRREPRNSSWLSPFGEGFDTWFLRSQSFVP